MARPTFRRFWVRIRPDGSALPQFDPRTGKYCGYEDYKGPVTQILFYPVTPHLAELIRGQGDMAEASSLPALIFDVPPGASSHLHRVGTLRLNPWHICGFCEAEFEVTKEVCPRCLAKNQWYCGTCDSLIEQPLLDQENNQIRCPVCETNGEPRGLRQIHCVGDFCTEQLFTHYVLLIDGKKHIILDYKRVQQIAF
ncbi:MAG: hypothetical protein ACYDG4_15125 [Desulfuromonadaceae bacterium]